MSANYRTALGYAIRTARISERLTLRQAATRAPMALGYLSELELGRKDASSEMLESVARAVGTTPGQLALAAAEVLLNWEAQEQLRETISHEMARMIR